MYVTLTIFLYISYTYNIYIYMEMIVGSYNIPHHTIHGIFIYIIILYTQYIALHVKELVIKPKCYL